MKVGTDGVLLGAWVALDAVSALPSPHVLDVGAGTGLIALMLAQRLEQAQRKMCAASRNVVIDAIEIDEAAAQQATENVARSPWPGQVRVICESVQTYRQQLPAYYDLIVANPPYFVNSSLAPDATRSLARHATALPFEELCQAVSRLLKPVGLFAVILPANQLTQAQDTALIHKLICRRCCWVKPRPQLPPKRVLLSFSYQEGCYTEDELTLELSRHQRTPEHRQLVQDFYLNP